jgi:hypothetical protein
MAFLSSTAMLVTPTWWRGNFVGPMGSAWTSNVCSVSSQRYKFSGRFQMVSGSNLAAEVTAVSRDVKGTSELGAYSIALEDIREIRPVR